MCADNGILPVFGCLLRFDDFRRRHRQNFRLRRFGGKIGRDAEIGDQIFNRENIKLLFTVARFCRTDKRKKHHARLRFDVAPRAICQLD